MLSNENYNRFKKLTTKQFNVKNCSCGETVSVRVCILNYLLHAVLQLFKNSGVERRRRSNRETRVCCVERGPSSIPLWDWVCPSPAKFQTFDLEKA